MILIIGPLPNPIDGCSYANKILCKNLGKKKVAFEVINTNTNIISSKQGNSFSLKKAFHFFKTYFFLYKILNAKTVYFTPGQTFFGLVKYAPFIILCIFLNRPYIIHVHGNHLGKEYMHLEGVKRKIFYFLVSNASAGIVLSKSLINNFKSLLPYDKIFIVENFAGDDLFRKSNQLIKKKDKPRIIYLSNLMEEKGILDLLDALFILDCGNVDFIVSIAGYIEDSIKLEVNEKLALLNSKVTYVGVIRGDEKIKYLQEANIFVLPTYYKMEGQPISILEALATGNIIVTTNHAGISDVISSSNGYLVSPKSPVSIADVISRINSNIEDEVDNFSKVNFKYAIENFTEEKFTNKIINITNLVSR